MARRSAVEPRRSSAPLQRVRRAASACAALLRALAPLVATWVTASVALRAPATSRSRWRALPGFWLTKLAWAWGAGGRG